MAIHPINGSQIAILGGNDGQRDLTDALIFDTITHSVKQVATSPVGFICRSQPFLGVDGQVYFIAEPESSHIHRILVYFCPTKAQVTIHDESFQLLETATMHSCYNFTQVFIDTIQ